MIQLVDTGFLLRICSRRLGKTVGAPGLVSESAGSINWKLSVMKYLQQIPLSSDSPVQVCLCWNYVQLLQSTSKEFCSFGAMLCYTLYMNRHGLEFHILTEMGTSVHMADLFHCLCQNTITMSGNLCIALLVSVIG